MRGHRGQKSPFQKNASPPTVYMGWSWDFRTWTSFTVSTKRFRENFWFEVIWSHRVQFKGQISKNASSSTHYKARSWDSCMWTSFTIPTKLMGQKVNLRSGGPQRSIKWSNFKQCQIGKLTMSTCWSCTNMLKCPWWPLHRTYRKGVKGQRKVKLQTTSNCKSNSANMLTMDK